MAAFWVGRHLVSVGRVFAPDAAARAKLTGMPGGWVLSLGWRGWGLVVVGFNRVRGEA